MTSVFRRRPWLSSMMLGLPVLVTAALAGLLRTEPQSALAPLMGPWAGRLYGHSDCTMATALPGWSAAAAVLFVLGAVSLTGSVRWRRRAVVLAMSLIGVVMWCGLALMSVVNSLE